MPPSYRIFTSDVAAEAIDRLGVLDRIQYEAIRRQLLRDPHETNPLVTRAPSPPFPEGTFAIIRGGLEATFLIDEPQRIGALVLGEPRNGHLYLLAVKHLSEWSLRL